MKIYIGTYNKEGSKGIYNVELNEKTGELSDLEVFAESENSKYMSKNKEKIYAIHSNNKGAGAGVVVYDISGEKLAECIYEEIPSCYIYVDDNNIYTANYHTGIITKLELTKECELRVDKKFSTKEKSGAHQVLCENGMLYVPFLNMNCIQILDLDLNPIEKIIFEERSGVRHAVISKCGRYMYVIGELSCKIYVVDLDTRKIVNEKNLLPEKESIESAGSAIRINREGNKIYCAIRGANIIVELDVCGNILEIKSTYNAEGEETRDILNVLDEKYLLLANQKSNKLVVIDLETKKKISELRVPQCACIIVEGE